MKTFFTPQTLQQFNFLFVFHFSTEKERQHLRQLKEKWKSFQRNARN